METLYDEYKKLITYYLKNYNTIKSCERLKRENIIESTGGYRYDNFGIKSNKIVDTTSSKALKLAEVSEDEIWIKLIDTVFANYYNEFAVNCIKEKYNIDGFKIRDTSYLCLCSRVTFQRYKKDIVSEIAKAYVRVN